jgi:hypothetical protein
MEDHRVFVSQAEIDQIRGKMRRRVLELPVEYGKLGELKLPVREGGVYTLKPPIPYVRYRGEAERHQPTRAIAVLRLIDLCDMPRRTVTITVTHPPERQGDKWLIRFEKGDWRNELGDPVYLAKYGDFTMTASKQAVPGDPELMSPFAEDLARARARALERRISPDREIVRRIKGELSPLQKSMIAMKARNRLNLILKEMDKLDAELSVDEAATFPESVCAARQMSAAVEGEPRPCGTESVVSLESAA